MITQGNEITAMMCHCCHWVEVDALVELDIKEAQQEAQPDEAQPDEAPPEAAVPEPKHHTHTHGPPTSSVQCGEDIRTLLRHMKELTEEGLLTESEASTLRLELMRSRLA